MGCWGGWLKLIVVLFLTTLIVSCGNTDKKSTSSGSPFVFQSRARLNLVARTTQNDPTVLELIATLLDPQGNPFRNQRVTFEAEFPDATLLPANTPQNQALACRNRNGTGNATRCTNRGAAITDDNGQAQVTLVAGLLTGRMRVIAEAPSSLNIANAISVTITNRGFLGGVDLAVFPDAATFINPLVQPGTDGSMVTFEAKGGTPPYWWTNNNTDLGRIDLVGVILVNGQPINEKAKYTLTGPIPTDQTGALQDTITLTDGTGASVTATITVIFADCTLDADGTTINIDLATGGEPFQVDVGDGVPPFTITDQFSNTFSSAVCNSVQKVCSFTLATPPPSVSPDNILIRDSRGCTANVQLTVTPRCGNGTVDPGEACDGTSFGGVTCADILGSSDATGTLLCSTDCSTIDTSFCRVPPADPLCGNGTIDPGEACDGTNFRGVTCADILGDSDAIGTLLCSSDCSTIDDGFCRVPPVEPLCGNGTINTGEECDGTDLRGVTCADLLGDPGATGTPLCSADCTFDDRFCQSPPAP
ncbi:MAG: hypothetical protein AB7G75_16055 [Candidatus Binatia bacterium]